MLEHSHDNENGFGLIVILVVMTIIAAIFFGSSYFSQKPQVETYVEVNRKAEQMIGDIEINTGERQKEIDQLEN